MSNINLICAMSANGIIGSNNSLPWHIPKDLQFFKKKTVGKVCIMGYNTYKSLSGILPGRINVVISSKNNLISNNHNLIFRSNIMEVLREFSHREIFVIGGAAIFDYFLQNNLVQTMFISKIHRLYEGDVYFPDVDFSKWTLKEAVMDNEITFQRWERSEMNVDNTVVSIEIFDVDKLDESSERMYLEDSEWGVGLEDVISTFSDSIRRDDQLNYLPVSSTRETQSYLIDSITDHQSQQGRFFCGDDMMQFLNGICDDITLDPNESFMRVYYR